MNKIADSLQLQACCSIATKNRGMAGVVVLTFLITLLFSSCNESPLSPIASATLASMQPRPTATIAFPTLPPINTFVPLQSATPTADLPATLGEIVFEDNFSTNRGWELLETDTGAISLLTDRLVIAIHKPNKLLFTYNSEIQLTDFYLTIEARSDLCSPGDEYGILFRVNDALEHYRFVLTCDGGARVTRILSAEARTLIPLSEINFLIQGPMATNRLSVWAFRDTFRFYINDVEIFSLRDLTLPEGSVGLFVQSGEINQVTVTFDNLAIQTLSPKPIPSHTPTP